LAAHGVVIASSGAKCAQPCFCMALKDSNESMVLLTLKNSPQYSHWRFILKDTKMAWAEPIAQMFIRV
jgi:hypothetical protein